MNLTPDVMFHRLRGELDDLRQKLADHEAWGDSWSEEVEARLAALEEQIAKIPDAIATTVATGMKIAQQVEIKD